MRAVAQRVNHAKVVVENEVVGEIGRGLLVYLGAAEGDDDNDVRYMADKLAGLRIFQDERDRMTHCVQDEEGGILVVSQFTLFGDVRRGRRPSFDGAAEPVEANRRYEQLVQALRDKGITVATGRFRAMMDVTASVDGPVTILVDSKKLF